MRASLGRVLIAVGCSSLGPIAVGRWQCSSLRSTRLKTNIHLDQFSGQDQADEYTVLL